MSNDITALRDELFAAMRGVKSGELDIDRARAVNEIGKTLVDTARVEVDYVKATGEGQSTFVGASVEQPSPPAGVLGIRQHRIKG